MHVYRIASMPGEDPYSKTREEKGVADDDALGRGVMVGIKLHAAV